jgi:hypothetical protein
LRVCRDFGFFGASHHVEERRDHRVRPGLEVVLLARVDAEHFGDDDHWQRRGDTIHQVELRVFDRVEQFVRDGCDAGPHRLHGFRCERFVDEAAQATVVRVVEKQHRRRLIAGELEARDEGIGIGLTRVGPERLVAQDLAHLIVRGDEPAVSHLVPLRRRPGAHLVQHRIRVALERLIERRQRKAGGGRFGHCRLHG